MKKILMALFALALLTVGIGAQSADSISKASTTNYYTKTSLSGEDLWKAMDAYQLSVSIATVNADGSPNAAVVIPGVTKDRGVPLLRAGRQSDRHQHERAKAHRAYRHRLYRSQGRAENELFRGQDHSGICQRSGASEKAR